MGEKFSRREFLKRAGLTGAALYGAGLVGADLLGLAEEAEAAPVKVMGIASSAKPELLVKKAVDAVGGIGKFVKRGQSVVIKPNLAWANAPEMAATTNPEVLKAIIELCKQAGARRVVIAEHTCAPSAAALERSKGNAVAAQAKIRLIAADSDNMYRPVSIPRGKFLKSDTCIREILDADVFINVPICKVHGSTDITASMKNLMGANWDRGHWHSTNLSQCIADYSTAVKPDLIILDAVRCLMTHGPSGRGEVKNAGQVIAGTDPVAIDSYAAVLLNQDPRKITHITAAAALGVGQIDYRKLRIKRV